MDDHDHPASQGTEIRHQLANLRSKISTLPELPPDASPGTVKKRVDLLEYVEGNIAEINKDLTRVKGQREGTRREGENTLTRPARLEALLPELGQSPLTASAYRKSILAYPEQGTLFKVEDRGFARLLRGFEDSEEEWIAQLEPLVEKRMAWGAVCKQASDNAGLKRVHEQLLAIDKFIQAQENAGCAEMLVDHVVRSVEIIRFMKIWTENEDKAGKKSWKGKYLTAACKNANPELYRRLDDAVGEERNTVEGEIAEALKRFKEAHQRVLKARKPLVMLYDHFGAVVFMDRLWDIKDGGATRRRSGGFAQFIAALCQELPADRTSQYDAGAHSLRMVLKVFAESSAASYVEAFMIKYPPK
ncbi:uncharacterized protein EV420DRAFT_1640478 [Desarmillaria tabescens]|uniref:Uncharacterized protein n=1 Tax=Armillaria tabescens TaxID=1929756 RepID=A0AA39N8H6_ARMTA|nr:uncharacterized protein EV420DRAFT_1640478 [Desarmillaria tabescens]KAK0460973.1 hypothetical protein EV420DRAFT_1640478 [Desarmillaria tabescens]